MILLAHSAVGSVWGTFIEPWEFHPALTHFPIAFLLGGVALDLYAWSRGSLTLLPTVRGLLIAGVLTGVVAALAGFLALFTVPAHTEEAHRLMYWHLGVQSAALVVFAWSAWAMRRGPVAGPFARGASWAAAALLLVGSGLGGYIVYHGGAGVEPALLSHELREDHDH